VRSVEELVSTSPKAYGDEVVKLATWAVLPELDEELAEAELELDVSGVFPVLGASVVPEELQPATARAKIEIAIRFWFFIFFTSFWLIPGIVLRKSTSTLLL
jgi:hypothetical protein